MGWAVAKKYNLCADLECAAGRGVVFLWNFGWLLQLGDGLFFYGILGGYWLLVGSLGVTSG